MTEQEAIAVLEAAGYELSVQTGHGVVNGAGLLESTYGLRTGSKRYTMTVLRTPWQESEVESD